MAVRSWNHSEDALQLASKCTIGQYFVMNLKSSILQHSVDDITMITLLHFAVHSDNKLVRVHCSSSSQSQRSIEQRETGFHSERFLADDASRFSLFQEHSAQPEHLLLVAAAAAAAAIFGAAAVAAATWLLCAAAAIAMTL